MPEIQYESHRGRGVAIGVAALAVALVLILGLVFRTQINDLLYQWGILHIDATTLVQSAEKKRESGDTKQALAVLEQGVNKIGTAKADKAKVYSYIAIYHQELGEKDEALKYFKLRRELTPSDHGDSLTIARLLRSQGKEAQAKPYFAEALADLKKAKENPMYESEVKGLEDEMNNPQARTQ